MNQLPRFSTGIISVSAMVLVGVGFSPSRSFGQCCFGAQNSVSESYDGRFRVEATSLTGTGHHIHGPYKFRFRALQVDPSGETEELGVFERAWATDKHFIMSVFVSPTGNGFALSTSLEQPIHFFAPDGTILATIDGQKSEEISCGSKGQPALEYKLRGRTRFGLRSTKLWLPLFHITGPESEWTYDRPPKVIVDKANIGFEPVPPSEIFWLIRMLQWRPELGRREAILAKELIAKKDEKDLVSLGLSALSHLEVTLATTTQPELWRAQREIVRRLCGHRDPWRNLNLLVALLEHPNEELRECALNNLRALLPKGEPSAQWVNKNQQHLQWDSEQNVYRHKPSSETQSERDPESSSDTTGIGSEK